MNEEYLLFPTTVPAFYVMVPESVGDVDLWLDDHLQDVEFREPDYD